LFMDHGEIVEHGTSDQMFESPKTDRLAAFLKGGR
jgi:ABC-type polar amino acid transport system ATPase subunit